MESRRNSLSLRSVYRRSQYKPTDRTVIDDRTNSITCQSVLASSLAASPLLVHAIDLSAASWFGRLIGLPPRPRPIASPALLFRHLLLVPRFVRG